MASASASKSNATWALELIEELKNGAHLRDDPLDAELADLQEQYLLQKYAGFRERCPRMYLMIREGRWDTPEFKMILDLQRQVEVGKLSSDDGAKAFGQWMAEKYLKK